MRASLAHIRRAQRSWRAAAVLAPAAVVLCVLLALTTAGSSDSAAGTTPTLSVDAASGRLAISPLIYGMNFADSQASSSEAASIGLPINRWGGNTTDTYNWQLGSSNLGNDWYFENVADCYYTCNGPNVPAYEGFIAGDQAIGAQTLLTLPLMGYVAKNAPTAHPLTCGFPASAFATQDQFDPYDAGCGDGLQGGQPVASDPTRDGVAIDPATNASAWVTALVARYGTAAQGGVGYYELGNEPALWNSTHRDMHPAATTEDELWQKSETTAAAVKAVDPTAKVLAFSEWGWPNYFCSAADGDGCTASSPDRAAHSGLPVAAYLLSEAHAYDQAHGGHLFDYLDLHYYAQGGSTTDVTRSLWDPTYTDPSWIGTQIELLPRMRQWIDQYDPGLGISLSEYNLSVGDAVTNALIQADTFGIFAREGVGIATRWALGNDGADIVDAYDMYRDYDGHGGRFGDTYVQSQSSDQGSLAVYGATRSSDGALTVMVINKTAGALTSPLSLSGFQAGASAQTWQWTGGAIAHAADQAVGAGGFTATYPADSITLFVIPAGTTGTSTTSTTLSTTSASSSTSATASTTRTSSSTSASTTSTTHTTSTTTSTTSHRTSSASSATSSGTLTETYGTPQPSSTTTTTVTTGDAGASAFSGGSAGGGTHASATSTSSSSSTSTVTSSTSTATGTGKGTTKRPPTRAQLLTKALVACHRLKHRDRRVRCEAAARKRYGPVKPAARRRARR